jgi:hypothetical protein
MAWRDTLSYLDADAKVRCGTTIMAVAARAADQLISGSTAR